MKRRVSCVVLLALAAALSALPVAAEDIYSPETLEIARGLLCPVCSGQSVADSNSELARQMRAIIEQKVQAGESPEQIRAYFVDAYGPSILADPPKRGVNLALWWLPVMAVILGAVVVALFLRERTRAGQGNAAPPERVSDEELEHIARDALGDDAQQEPSAP